MIEMLQVLENRRRELRAKLLERARDIIEEIGRVDKLIEAEKSRAVVDTRRRDERIAVDFERFRQLSAERAVILKSYNSLTSDATAQYSRIKEITNRMKNLASSIVTNSGGTRRYNAMCDEISIERPNTSFLSTGRYNSLSCPPELREEWSRYYKPDIIDAVEIDVDRIGRVRLYVFYKGFEEVNMGPVAALGGGFNR
jgi:hypothetical protein